jgi:RimJ/RimL family protein N-acetyltransferase
MNAHALSRAKVLLRPLTERDSALLHSWINDRQLVELSARFKPVTVEEHHKWFRDIRQRSDVQIFAIADPETSATIGYCQLKHIDPLNRSTELQIRIGSPQHQGRGLGTAAVLALLDVAFDELELHRVYLHVFEHNVRARRCYEKCGFRTEGLFRNALFLDGRPINLVMMAIIRSERPSHARPGSDEATDPNS